MLKKYSFSCAIIVRNMYIINPAKCRVYVFVMIIGDSKWQGWGSTLGGLQILPTEWG